MKRGRYLLLLITAFAAAGPRAAAQYVCGPVQPIMAWECSQNLCFIAAPCREACSGPGPCGWGVAVADIGQDCNYDPNNICAVGWSCTSDPEWPGYPNGYVEAAIYRGSQRLNSYRAWC